MNDAAITAMPEAALAAADHVLGDPHAKVTQVAYGDCECPASIQAEPLVQHWIDTCGGRLRLLYRHFPQMEAHPNAELAALPNTAACGARRRSL